MKMIVWSAVFALGLGFAGASTASAANEAPTATNAASHVTTDMSARCWSRRVCWHGYYSHRRCEWRTVCNHRRYHY